MSVIRICKSTDPFARVNKAMLADPRLSWKAKGILAYLIGKPNGWKVQINDLVAHSTDGISAIYSTMKELREFGYARLRVVRLAGKITEHIWDVRDLSPSTPKLTGSGTPDSGFLSVENLNSENRGLSKKEGKQERNIKKEAATPSHVPSFDLVSADAPTAVKFSGPVTDYANFSRRKEFHIRVKLGPDQFKYNKGGQAGGWSRTTLISWERAWTEFMKDKDAPDQVRSTLAFYLQNYDHLTEHRNAPVARSLLTFIERYGWISQVVRKERRLRAEEGLAEAPEVAEEAPIIKAKPVAKKKWTPAEHEAFRRSVDGP